MGIFSNILFAADYDLTITARDGSIPAANVEAVRRFIEGGGIFTVATGRSRSPLAGKEDCIMTNAPHIIANGAAAGTPDGSSWSFCSELPDDYADVVSEVLARYASVRAEVHAFGRPPLGFQSDSAEEREAFLALLRSDELPHPRLKLCFRVAADSDGAENFIDGLQDFLVASYANEYNIERPSPHIVEAQCVGTSKGIAARKLAEIFGRSILVCAGDAKNDLSMLEEADVAYVPADGDPSILGRGFRIAAACSDGAIASIIEDLAACAAGKEGTL